MCDDLTTQLVAAQATAPADLIEPPHTVTNGTPLQLSVTSKTQGGFISCHGGPRRSCNFFLSFMIVVTHIFQTEVTQHQSHTAE